MLLEDTATIAGFFAAHAIWCVSDGEPLQPMLGFAHADERREMARLETETLEDGVRVGLEWLEENPQAVDQAVLIYDGFMTLPGEQKRDALIIEARRYGEEPGGFTMAIPYRSASDAKGFAVYRPKFVDLENAEAVVMDLSTAFFKGVNQHKEAAPVWKAHMAEIA